MESYVPSQSNSVTAKIASKTPALTSTVHRPHRWVSWSCLLLLLSSVISSAQITVKESPQGFLHVWSNNYAGGFADREPVTRELGSVIEFAGGDRHHGAILADGSAATWSPLEITSPDVNDPKIISLITGRFTSYAILEGGTVIDWPRENLFNLNVPEDLPPVTAVAAGWTHCLALKEDGSLVSWGMGQGVNRPPVPLTDVQAIAAGRAHNLALRADGTVVAWGFPDHGRTAVPEGLNDVVAIAAGEAHSVALTADGRLHAFGYPDAIADIPTDRSDFVAIAAADMHTIALTRDGTVEVWNAPAPLIPTIPPNVRVSAIFANTFTVAVLTDQPFPIIKTRLEPLTVAAGQTATLSVAVRHADPVTYQWFKNGTAIAGATNPVLDFPSAAIADAGTYTLTVSGEELTSVSTSATLTVQEPVTTLPREGRVRGWNSGPLTFPDGSDTFTKVAAGHEWTLFLRSNGTLEATGRNDQGQTEIPEDLPPVNDIATGSFHALVITESGQVRAWGDNRAGQSDVPEGLDKAIAIAGGLRHSVAVTQDGSVIAWGDNRHGQTDVPPQLDNVVKVVAAEHHTVALRSDGTVVAWGLNLEGQVDVPDDLETVIDIGAGINKSVALQVNGRLRLWGRPAFAKGSQEENLEGLTHISAGGHWLAYRLVSGKANMYPVLDHLPFVTSDNVIFVEAGFHDIFVIEAPPTPAAPALRLSVSRINETAVPRLRLTVEDGTGTPLSPEEAAALIFETKSDLHSESPWRPIEPELDSETGSHLVIPLDAQGYFRARKPENTGE